VHLSPPSPPTWYEPDDYYTVSSVIGTVDAEAASKKTKLKIETKMHTQTRLSKQYLIIPIFYQVKSP
jgi:hypothetical protein